MVLLDPTLGPIQSSKCVNSHLFSLHNQHSMSLFQDVKNDHKCLLQLLIYHFASHANFYKITVSLLQSVS